MLLWHSLNLSLVAYKPCINLAASVNSSLKESLFVQAMTVLNNE